MIMAGIWTLVISSILCILVANIGVTSASQPIGTTVKPQTSSGTDLKIAAFNVQVFGRSKMGKPDVVRILVQIIQRYDVVLIQEIRDASGESIIQLLEQVNSAGHNYDMVISERLGRTSSKEQYAFFYRSGIGLDAVSTYQYPDPDDKFQREPFAVLLKVPNDELKQFAMVAIHVDPGEAEDEIDELVEVHKAIKRHWKMNNIMIMGDLNAAPPYTTKKEMKKLKLRDSKYLWLIPDTIDTTIGKSDSAYDRFIVTGKELKNSIVPGSATAFRFNEFYNLDNDQSKAVSDHFPIEVSLKMDGGIAATNGGSHRRGFLSKAKEFAKSIFSSDQHEL